MTKLCARWVRTWSPLFPLTSAPGAGLFHLRARGPAWPDSAQPAVRQQSATKELAPGKAFAFLVPSV